ncbi:MAG: COX15/CtaA family protein [Lewinellaceae bacterium]|nr:COX15/CtaA family protein [Lewinellaceae bacterium]
MFKIAFTEDTQISRALKIWLIAGLVMIFMQVIIGGVTRLTGSGLSITKWEVVHGIIPPLSEQAWQTEFELYKATPQYQKINQGMDLPAFKFIYFWEFFHRFWARLMFFVFIIPFGWFLFRGMFSKRLLPRMVVVVLLAGLEGFFGWIMVASGLINRPWVNAYNLTLHLCMALIIFGYLLWTTFIAFHPKPVAWASTSLKKWAWWIVGITFVQIALGAMMSGSKAGLFYPTWPTMHGVFLPNVLLDASQWKSDSFIHYDVNPFMPALIQFFHRNVAYVLSILILFFVYKQRSQGPVVYQRSRWMLVGMLVVQVCLGIFTLINCKAKVPIGLGVYHQAGAVILFGLALLSTYQIRTVKND